MRAGLVLLNGAATYFFALVFAWFWTDELVDGSPYATADPRGTAVGGALAGVVPVVIGTVICVLLVWRTPGQRVWPLVMTGVAGVAGAVVGTASRFHEGMPTALGTVLQGVALATAAIAVVVLRRSGHPEHPSGTIPA